MTLAQELKTLALTKLEELKKEEPQPLNQEALDFILETCQQAAEAGFFSQEFFIDRFYEKHFSLEKQTRFYQGEEVLALLEDPKHGFTLDVDYTGEGISVKVQWGDYKNDWINPITVEVPPPDEYLSFIKKQLRYPQYQ